MMSFAMIVFLLAALAMVGGGTYTLYGMNYTKGAVLFFIGAAYFSVLYGLRWFGSDSSPFTPPPGSWPPVVNTCPDYLTAYTRTKDGKKVKTCIDQMGVSSNGGIKVFPSSGEPPVDDSYYFPINTTNADPGPRNNELCQRAIAAGLTWEGITNGESCFQADGSVVSPSSSTGQCG